MKRTLFLSLSILAHSILDGLCQGSLEPPPGPPGPTMVSLADVDPGGQALPDPSGITGLTVAPFVITQPGCYRLQANLGSAATVDPVVSIRASYVTLDLNGYAIQGTHAGEPLISIDGNSAAAGVVIRNGRLNGVFSQAILCAPGNNGTVTSMTRVSNVAVSHSSPTPSTVAFNLGPLSRVENCEVNFFVNSSGYGAKLGGHGIIRESRFTGGAVRAESGAHLKGVTVRDFSAAYDANNFPRGPSYALSVGSRSIVLDAEVYLNKSDTNLFGGAPGLRLDGLQFDDGSELNLAHLGASLVGSALVTGWRSDLMEGPLLYGSYVYLLDSVLRGYAVPYVGSMAARFGDCQFNSDLLTSFKNLNLPEGSFVHRCQFTSGDRGLGYSGDSQAILPGQYFRVTDSRFSNFRTYAADLPPGSMVRGNTVDVTHYPRYTDEIREGQGFRVRAASLLRGNHFESTRPFNPNESLGGVGVVFAGEHSGNFLFGNSFFFLQNATSPNPLVTRSMEIAGEFVSHAVDGTNFSSLSNYAVNLFNRP